MSTLGTFQPGVRPKPSDHALRKDVNALIAVVNGGEREQAAAQCRALIETHFAAGGYESDGDIASLLVHVLSYFLGGCDWEPEITALQCHPAALSDFPVAFLSADDRRNDESRYLDQYRRNVTSQGGEDGVIEAIFERIGVDNKWAVEFGAFDGVKYSNTHNLITNHDWHCVMIEPDPGRFGQLVENLREYDRVVALQKLVGIQTGTDTLDKILGETAAPHDLDLMSIDVDGNDWHIWASLKTYRPRVVIIEINFSIPNDVYFVKKCDFGVAKGSSLKAIVALGKLKGYELAFTTPYNAIFVVEEAFPALGIADNSIEAMHQPLANGRVFQGYDTTIMTVGMPKMMWGSNSNPRDTQNIGLFDLKLVRDE